MIIYKQGLTTLLVFETSDHDRCKDIRVIVPLKYFSQHARELGYIHSANSGTFL